MESTEAGHEPDGLIQETHGLVMSQVDRFMRLMGSVMSQVDRFMSETDQFMSPMDRLTYEFYEAPQPWGPWRKFLYKDFGPYPWTGANSGGYAATVPSKYISPEGGTMWVQSNTWNPGVVHNDFALRTLQISQ
jgi:hypothetical protein